MNLLLLLFLGLALAQHTPLVGRYRRQLSSRATLWPDGVVYYAFNDDTESQDSDFKEYTRDAMDLISEVSCITFQEDDSQTHRLLIKRTHACYSDIGMTTGNSQTVYLHPDCHEMEAVHEFLHALGFIHTHQRGDRDKYVRVNFSNVQKEKMYNFNVRREWKMVVPYDYGSIMHYGQFPFAVNKNRPVMTPVNKDYSETIGSRKMSYYDILMINDVYKCAARCKGQQVPKCKNYGYPNPSDCENCICPNGYGGTTCEDRTDDGCGATFQAGENWAMGVLISNVHDPQWFVGQTTGKLLQAPANTTIEVKINRLTQFQCRQGCDNNFVEIKTNPDPRASYPRFCCSDTLDKNNVISSSNPTVIVMGNMKSHHVTAHVEYRYVGGESEDYEESETEETTTESTYGAEEEDE